MNSLRLGVSLVVGKELIDVNDTVLVLVSMVEDRTALVLGEGEAEGFEGVLEFLEGQVIFLSKIGGVEGGYTTVMLNRVGLGKLLTERLEGGVLSDVVFPPVKEIGAHTGDHRHASSDEGLGTH